MRGWIAANSWDGSRPLRAELLSFTIAEPLTVRGVALADVPFPAGVEPMFVIRDADVMRARPELVLEPGDSVHLYCPPQARQEVRLMFGQDNAE